MRRREFLRSALITASGAALLPTDSSAYQSCAPFNNAVGKVCEVGISPPNFIGSYQGQTEAMWCWAASIAMIFKYYGYRISQKRIVEEALGEAFNVGANGTLISQQLSRHWTDDVAQDFEVSISGVYDVENGENSLNNMDILQALADEKPLLFGTTHHAMVLVQAAYIPLPAPQIYNLGLLDPYPGVGTGPDGEPTMAPVIVPAKDIGAQLVENVKGHNATALSILRQVISAEGVAPEGPGYPDACMVVTEEQWRGCFYSTDSEAKVETLQQRFLRAKRYLLANNQVGQIGQWFFTT